MYELFPEELKKQKQWVCAKKLVKIPFKATDFSAASSCDPSTWSTFKAAYTSVLDGFNGYVYLGYVFNDNGIVGIDLDHCIDGSGNYSLLAQDILQHTSSYAEFSKSGKGLHILVKGNMPFSGTNNRQGLEIYKSKRFFVCTGKALENHTSLLYDQQLIDMIIEKYLSFSEPMQPETQQQQQKTSIRKCNKPLIYQPIYKLEKHNFTVTYPPIDNGARHMSLLSIAGQFWTIGCDLEDIVNLLFKLNSELCIDPLPDSEIYQILRSVTKYARSN